ncbi:MAG TPA: YCF48-related protein [Ignavibacteriaceae bacterium]|nr:YCF48-related protein [Ignavibacteriaceae bacterium]
MKRIIRVTYIVLLDIIFFSIFCFGQWFWQNPLPQGNTLLSVFMVNPDLGYTVGTMGTILKTTDGGKNWLLQKSNTKMALLSVYFLNENIGWVSGQWGTLLKTINGGLNWTEQNCGNIASLESIYFFNKDTGWAVGGLISYDNVILKTTDGGKNWVTKYSEPCTLENLPFRAISWVDSAKGWVAGDNKVLKTIDGGEQWTQQNYNLGGGLMDICFTDSSNGWAAGSCLLARTTDGGENWYAQTNIPNLLTRVFDSIHFLNFNFGWITCSDGYILKTTNGGNSWVQYLTNFELGLHSIFFTDANTGWVVGEMGTIQNTTNSGNNWLYKAGKPLGIASSIFFINKNTGWVAGYQYNSSESFISKTTDGGNHWIEQPTNFLYCLTSIFFLNENLGWSVGINKIIIKTTDGGNTWNEKPIGISLSKCGAFHDVLFTDENNGYIVGERETIIKTTDGGDTWTLQHSGPDARFASIYFSNSNTGWVSGNNGIILKTTDAGITWIPQNSNTTGYVSKISFFNADLGWAVAGSVLLKTTNGGNDWNQTSINIPGTHGVINMLKASFLTPDLGWGVVITGDVYYMYGIIVNTTDGGATWNIQECPTDDWFNNILFVDENTGWASGAMGTILKTNNGGSVTDVKVKVKNIPTDYSLYQNYPNPFNPTTVIRYRLPANSFVMLKVYDILGRKVSTLVNEEKTAGTYEVEFNGINLSSGVYFYKIQAGDFISTKKFILLR